MEPLQPLLSDMDLEFLLGVQEMDYRSLVRRAVMELQEWRALEQEMLHGDFRPSIPGVGNQIPRAIREVYRGDAQD